MSTSPVARVQRGVPTGGQFAATFHAEPVVFLGDRRDLTPGQRESLDGWPHAYALPEVDFSLADDGGIITSVSIGGKPALEVWKDGDGDYDHTVFEFEGVEDDDAFDRAVAWSQHKHDEIESVLRAEMEATAARLRPGLVGKANGYTKQLTDDQLESVATENNAAVGKARKDAELAATAIIARGVLEKHPDAAYAEVGVGGYDNGQFVDSIKAIGLNGQDVLGEYRNDGDDDETPSWASHISGLEPESENGWWSDYNPNTGDYSNDKYLFDLRQAAAWMPKAVEAE